jgi:hypothetical protein
MDASRVLFVSLAGWSVRARAAELECAVYASRKPTAIFETFGTPFSFFLFFQYCLHCFGLHLQTITITCTKLQSIIYVTTDIIRT